MTATTPIWGKLADLFEQEAARPDGAGHLLGRLADRRLRPDHGGADRRPRRPGPRRRRPDRAGPGRHRHDGLPARARSLQRLHRRGLRARPRSAARWSVACSSTPVGWRWLLLRRPAGRGARLRRAAEDAAPARSSSGTTSRSTTSAPPCSSAGVSILLVWVSLGRPATSSGSPGPARCSSSAAVAVIAAAIYVEAKVATDPVIPLRLFKDRTIAARHRRLRADRRRDVRLDGLPRASTSSSPEA